MGAPSKRARVFSLLDLTKREGMTLAELCDSVPCSPKTARGHVVALMESGTVRRDRLEPDGETRGQPPYVYFLAKHGPETVG